MTGAKQTVSSLQHEAVTLMLESHMCLRSLSGAVMADKQSNNRINGLIKELEELIWLLGVDIVSKNCR